MPLVNFFSVRVTDPDLCSEYYAESRRGKAKPGEMQIDSCILKKHEGNISGGQVTDQQWRDFGITQRFLLPDENVQPCKQRKGGKMLDTLCPLNSRGIKEIASIEIRFGPILKMKGTPEEYTISKVPVKMSK